MGYFMEMTDSKFEIKKENFTKALESLKSAFVPENMNCYDYYGGNRHPHFSWVDTDSVLESKTLDKALKEIRYKPKYDGNGDICNVEFTGQKYGSEEVFFNALAPYVESGSYIAFEGEDGDKWEWSFNDGNVEQIKNNELVDKIASFFETEENWSALKHCWIENGHSEDLRKLLARALKG